VVSGEWLVEGERTGGVALGLDVHRTLAGEDVGSAEARELAARFTSSELGRRAARATRIEREFDFLLYVAGIVLRGQIDLWFEEANELIVVDYKTDRDESPDQYELQLRIYALALERYAGRLPDRAMLYYLRSDRAVEVSLDQGALDLARGVVGAFLDAQELQEFPLKVGQQCRRCPLFQNRCPAQLFVEAD
jgi:CRISPR/Cas system-associated exonuclease Cas4 (RecB family)